MAWRRSRLGDRRARVKAVLTDRTIPFSRSSRDQLHDHDVQRPGAGGTTAHGVGATLMAIVLGPWAAVIAVSVALIIQALFFGDGGVLAIFVNCFNMAIVMPFVGYWTYRLLAGRSRVVDPSGVGGRHRGVCRHDRSAVAVGIELGIQPPLFSENGHALYSPYGLERDPRDDPRACLRGVHRRGADHLARPDLSAAAPPRVPDPLRGAFADADAIEGEATRRPFWQVIGATVIGAWCCLDGRPGDRRR